MAYKQPYAIICCFENSNDKEKIRRTVQRFSYGKYYNTPNLGLKGEGVLTRFVIEIIVQGVCTFDDVGV